jgi:hypothetical protein
LPVFSIIKGGIYSLSDKALRSLLKAVHDRGKSFRFKARGQSMHPFICDGDIVSIAPTPTDLHMYGQVVACIHPAYGKLVVHRIVKCRTEALILKGDNNPQPDGLVAPSAILGVVAAVYRGNRKVRLGLGPERRIIAWLSRRQMLPLMVRCAGWMVRPVLRLIKKQGRTCPSPSNTEGTSGVS